MFYLVSSYETKNTGKLFIKTNSIRLIPHSVTKIRISAKYCIRYGKIFYLCIVNGNIYRAYK